MVLAASPYSILQPEYVGGTKLLTHNTLVRPVKPFMQSVMKVGNLRSQSHDDLRQLGYLRLVQLIYIRCE